MIYRILLIDDSTEVASSTGKILEYEGYAVDVEPDPLKALSRLQQGTYHLIICDTEIPEMNGFQFKRTIDTLRVNVPFVAWSGYDHSADWEQLGVDFLLKPVKVEDLLQYVSQVMKRYKTE